MDVWLRAPSPVWKSAHSYGRMPSRVTQTLDFAETKVAQPRTRGANDQEPIRNARRSRLRGGLRHHRRTQARTQTRARSGAGARAETRAQARAATARAETRGETKTRRREDHLRGGRAVRLRQVGDQA